MIEEALNGAFLSRTFILALCAVVVAGCEGSGASRTRETQPAAAVHERSEPSTASRQPRLPAHERACFFNPSTSEVESRRGPLVGDVDGDSLDDRVWITAERAGRRYCRYFLVLDGSNVRDRLEIHHREQWPQFNWYLEPRYLASLDRAVGAEIGVNVQRGASTEFLILFTFLEGQLAPIAIEGNEGFSYAGSLGHLSTVNCGSSPAQVVATGAGWDGRRYRLERETFTFRGTSLVRTGMTRAGVASRAEAGVIFPELKEAPFSDCSGVREPVWGTPDA